MRGLRTEEDAPARVDPSRVEWGLRRANIRGLHRERVRVTLVQDHRLVWFREVIVSLHFDGAGGERVQ